MPARLLVRVPASSANLGPGFDTFAAAVTCHLELELTETGRFEVHTDLPFPADRTNLCVRAFERLLGAGDFRFEIRSQIPLSGGLGSSAAAIVAGLAAAAQLVGGDIDLLALATELERHPDNVAAALHGGFVVCLDGGVVCLAPPAGLDAVTVVPHERVATERARAVLADQVAIGDAVFNVAHGAALMLGLERGDWDLVARGLADRLHQDRRAHLFEPSAALLARARSLGALGATISGAGPAVLVWCIQEQTAAVTERLHEQADGWATVLHTPFDAAGVELRLL